MKKRRTVVGILAVIMAFATGALAKEVYEVVKAQIRPDFVIEIDGVERAFKNANGERVFPLLHDGTTYLPLRAIGEIMDKKVYWYEEDKRIELKDDTGNLSTVTDADVIIDKSQNPKEKDKEKPKEFEGVDEKELIGIENAKEIALKKAGLKETDVEFIKVEIDRDDGIVIYEIEFKHGLKEFSADIKADDGKILDWEVDLDD